MSKVRLFSLLHFVESALTKAEYERDEDGIVLAQIPGTAGFFAEGDTFEEACTNLCHKFSVPAGR